MPREYFKVRLDVRPVGGGEADLVPPPALEGLRYRFVVVKEGGEEAVVALDEPRSVLTKLQKRKDCTRLTAKQLEALQADYPAPKLKERYRQQPAAQAPAGVAPDFELDEKGNRIVDVVQTVRAGTYLIDVPVVGRAPAPGGA